MRITDLVRDLLEVLIAAIVRPLVRSGGGPVLRQQRCLYGEGEGGQCIFR